jgi:hypothetical protein
MHEKGKENPKPEGEMRKKTMSKRIKVQKDVVLEARYSSKAAAYVEGRREMPINEYESKYNDVMSDFECADYSADASDYRLRDCNLCFTAEVQAEVTWEYFGLYVYAEATLPTNADLLAAAKDAAEFDEMTEDEILSVFTHDRYFWESCAAECTEFAEAAFKKVCKAAGIPLKGGQRQ